MIEVRRKPSREIKVGSRVFIQRLIGVSEREASALIGYSRLQDVRQIKQSTEESMERDFGLSVGSTGVVKGIYITGYSSVLFDANAVFKKPFNYDIPTVCLAVK